jgi:endonuclease/exonuclease/phosphatase family metal-dependent hydrolase
MNPEGSNIHQNSNQVFSALTLNLRFGLADDGLNSWRYRKKGLPALFKNYRADFIGLQEANDFQIDFIKHFLVDYEFIGKKSPAPSYWQNNILFHKKTWECIHHEHFFLSPTPMIPSRFRGSRWPRQCTLGMFQNRGRKLICSTTHFDFSEAVQMQSARLILKRLSFLPSEIPAIIMGDFNATPASACHRIFTGQGEKMVSDKFRFKNVFKKPFPGTYHGFSGDITGDCIDWIIYRGAIIPVDYRVIIDTFNNIYPSDHFPVIATFKLFDEKGNLLRKRPEVYAR